MFSEAYRVARNFTRPVAISTRMADGRVACGLATFIAVNKDGWIITAAHVLRNAHLAPAHLAERQELDRKRAEISSDPNLGKGRRKRELARLAPNPDWITNYSFWWCQDGVQITEVHVDIAADIAILKLANFDLSGIAAFPKFKDPKSDPPPGGSLCRLGFPFVEVRARFDDATKGFTLTDFALPPMFPNDGIHTRIMVAPDPVDGRIIKFIETSTPGLRGQSGGPLFNTKGEIWGVQSQTSFLELGFTPRKRDGNREIVEHQFMNVGLATHVQHVVELFRKYGVAFDSA